MTISFELTGLPHPMNVVQRKYRNPFKRNAYYKGWYQQVALATLKLRPEMPLKSATLTIAVHLSAKRFRDYDGLVASLKPIVDGFKLSKLIADDNYKVTGPWIVTQVADKNYPDGLIKIKIEGE